MKISGELGLRDKKRAETRSRLERAAVTLVERDGLAHATVDAISEAAGVSPRTFFNYFDSKEDAVLGVRDIELTEASIAEHVARPDGADLTESVVRLLIGVIGPTIATTDMRELRMHIIKTHPELFSRHISQMTRMADQLVAAVTGMLEADPAHRARQGNAGARAVPGASSVAIQAEMLLTLCGGGVRVAIKEWIALGSTTPTELLETRAIELVREVTKNIQ